jgi:hypothetical protein
LKDESKVIQNKIRMEEQQRQNDMQKKLFLEQQELQAKND